jgi:RNA polymerase nonessential primary-like sigma factor
MLKVLDKKPRLTGFGSSNEGQLPQRPLSQIGGIASPKRTRASKSEVCSSTNSALVVPPRPPVDDTFSPKPPIKGKEVPLDTDPVKRFMADAKCYPLFTPEREREIGRALMAARAGYLGELLESFAISSYAASILERVVTGKVRADRHLIYERKQGKATLAKGAVSHKTVKVLLARIAENLPASQDQSVTGHSREQAALRIAHSRAVVRTLLEEVQFSDKVVGNFIDTFRTRISQCESRLAKDASSSETRKVFEELGESLESAKARLSRINEYLSHYREARADVVRSNLRLVVSIASSWIGNGIPMEDLIGYGMPGLMRAAEKFDVERGFKFSTYATRWISQGMWRAVDVTGEAFDVPVHIGALKRTIRRAQREAEKKNGKPASVEELADITGCSIEDVQLAIRLHKKVRRVDAPLSVSSDDSESLGSLLPAKPSSVVDEATSGEIRSAVRGILNELSPREREILCMRFGLPLDETQHNYPKPMTLKEVGDKIGVTRE